MVADYSLFTHPATEKDLELIDNLKYALENGNATLQIDNNHTHLIFKANFGTISGKPVIFGALLKNFTHHLGKAVIQKKYDNLLEQYTELMAKYDNLLAMHKK
jgi:hypothetical protein